MNSADPGTEPREDPFGEDITNPDARTMPPEFHGEWARDPADCHARRSGTRTVIGSGRIVVGENAERVVAVRFIEAGAVPGVTRPVAVVTLPAGGDREQQYSVFYFGLSDDGQSLIDLESMDWVLRRCRTAATEQPDRGGDGSVTGGSRA
jgi:hypothetical protein